MDLQQEQSIESQLMGVAGNIIKEFFDFILNYIQTVFSYPDHMYMVLLFLTSYVLLKKTSLKLLSSDKKTLIIFGIGIIYGLAFLTVEYIKTDLIKTIEYSARILISLMATILFNNFIWEYSIKLWNLFFIWLKNKIKRK